MATTYTLIAGTTLSSTSATIEFTAIPQTYTDLLLKITDHIDQSSTQYYNYVKFNDNTSAIYNNVAMYGRQASGFVTIEDVNQTKFFDDPYQTLGTGTTATVFSHKEMYIPQYTSSSVVKLIQNNYTLINSSTANSDIGSHAGLFNSTSPITKITLFNFSSWVFQIGTTAFLYGIKNS
jgi:hypothetical protein